MDGPNRHDPPRAPPVARGSVKGTILLSRIDLARARGGDVMVERVLSRLTTEERRVVGGLLLPMAWYPFELSERLDASLAQELGGGDRAYRELGAQSAEDALSQSLKSYARSRDPHGLLKQAAQLHRQHKDSGYMTYEWVDKTSAILRSFDCKSVSHADCQTILGWFEKAIDLCGGREARAVESQCQARGAKSCEYKFEWEASTGLRSRLPPTT